MASWMALKFEPRPERSTATRPLFLELLKIFSSGMFSPFYFFLLLVYFLLSSLDFPLPSSISAFSQFLFAFLSFFFFFLGYAICFINL